MMPVNPMVERGSVGWQVFKTDAEFLGGFDFSLPSIVGSNRTLDLSAYRQARFDGSVSQTISVSAGAGRGPSDKHDFICPSMKAPRQA
jgi:hypothetical protein